MRPVVMRRGVVDAAVDVGVGPADHVQGLVLHLVHQPGRRRRARAVGDPVPVPGVSVSPRVVDQIVVLGGEVVDLRLFCVVVVVASAFDDVRRVVGRSRDAAGGQRRAAHHGQGGRLGQRLLQLLGVGGRVRGVRGVRGVRRGVRGGGGLRGGGGSGQALHQGLLESLWLVFCRGFRGFFDKDNDDMRCLHGWTPTLRIT